MDSADPESQDIEQCTPAEDIFVAPSIHTLDLVGGISYTHSTPIPQALQEKPSIECVLGVDEAGRGPVLGPMVYGLLYLPLEMHRSLLAETHHFDDSKVLTPVVRSSLMRELCTTNSELWRNCGWATRVMSARDISSGMMRNRGAYNLNAQAMDATIDLIKGVFEQGVNVTEIYIDTIGSPVTYQKKLERIFPTTKITVAKKADSLYPCVSAASVCAKVTRDAALETLYEAYISDSMASESEQPGWGSGYPSDSKCSTWLKAHMDPVFGWGNECRFSWGTVKDLLEVEGNGVKVEWPLEEADETMRVTDFFANAENRELTMEDELATWFGGRAGEDVF